MDCEVFKEYPSLHASTEKQPEPFQQDNDEEVANDEGEWTVVKRKKPHDIGRVSKTLLKLRAPCYVGEYVQQ